MKRTLLAITATLLLATSAIADDGKPPSPGLSFFVNAGAFWADKNTANFYSGRESNVNTIYRVLHSNTYGQQIYDYLKTQDYITDAVGGYQNLQVVEWANMYYRTSYQIGLGVRYDYSSGLGWLLRADIAQLTALGIFNLSSNNGTGILGSKQYVPFNIFGQEERISIDAAITGRLDVSNNIQLEVDLGASVINTKVKENMIGIDGKTWSILDRWNGQTPDYGVSAYNQEILQGGIGYGVFISAVVGYSIPSLGSLKAVYTCYQSKTVLRDYTAWGWQHMLGIRAEINNFKIFE